MADTGALRAVGARGMVVALALAAAGPALAQLRVVEWNVSNYSGGRVAEFQTAIYGVSPANGLSLAPDVILGQEFISQAGVDAFLDLLNDAPGSPGDWEAAPFINGPDTDNICFYRTTRVDFLGVTVVAEGGPSPNHPRDVERYDLRPAGYEAPAAVLACYSSHMKASTGSGNEARRLLEAQRIRDDAQTLPAAWSFLLASDMNIQDSAEAAYEELVGSQANDAGRFFDPIASPGHWNNDGAFRFIHTQDPIGAGGMDDRYDQILVSAALLDGDGLDYVGNPAIPYSTTTWNDPNHSYRAWGNDGTSFNANLTTTGNTMVGSTIAVALRVAADGAGHLPVRLDLRVPAKVGSPATLDFGSVPEGSIAQQILPVLNAGDVALWTAGGIDDLDYTLGASAGLTVPPGPFTDPAGGGGNAHVVALDTSTPGPFSGSVVIASNDVDEPLRTVSVTAQIVGAPGCPADLDGSGDVAFADLLILLGAWGPCPACPADLDGSGDVAFADLLVLLGAWGAC